MLNRRQFGLAALFGMTAAAARAQPPTAPQGPGAGSAEAAHDMSMFPQEWLGDEQIVLLGFQGMTALDLIGPQHMFANLWGADVKIVAKTMDPLVTDAKVVILPDQTFADAAAAPDVICVPGAVGGILEAMQDEETITFLKDRGSNARYVTSVCTGSLLLGAAGLLDGYRASSHWVTRPLLEGFGANPVDERVVRDRNRVAGGGVTAGLDLGLSLLAEMRDDDYARTIQLLAEYDPKPPFDSGTPRTAPTHVTDSLTEMFAGFTDGVRRLIDRTRPL